MVKKLLKILAFIAAIILLFAGFVAYRAYRFYSSVFRITYEQAISALPETPSGCVKLMDCKLQPGDILIRRYVTPVTEAFYETLNPYFTHTAFYMGNGEIFEAVGNYTAPQDQIVVEKLSETDWARDDVADFVIVRPKNYGSHLDSIISDLRDIADDPRYVFGPLTDGKTMVSCSDIILKYFTDYGMIAPDPKKPFYITPDYLYYVTTKDPADFAIPGYSLAKESPSP